MKFAINKLVLPGVVKPKVYGVYCENDNLYTYTMDLASSKV